MGFFEDIRETVEGKKRLPTISQVTDNISRGVQDVGNLSRAGTGSFGYINPLTSGFQLAADYFNQEDRKKQAEADADAARERLDQSTSLADQVRKRQGLFAAQLKENALKNYGLLSNQAASNEKRALAESLRDAKLAAASRGLVGSGFQKMAQAKAKAGAAANTASKQKQIGELLQQQIMDAEDLQAQLGLEMGGISQNMSDQYYQMAIQNMQNRGSALNSLIGAGARVGGAYLGSRNNSGGSNSFG